MKNIHSFCTAIAVASLWLMAACSPQTVEVVATRIVTETIVVEEEIEPTGTATKVPVISNSLESVSNGINNIVSISADGTQGNGDSLHPSISADGDYIAFVSWADNLVENDDNDYPDVYVYDRNLQSIKLVSVSQEGSGGNAISEHPFISADGCCIVFDSAADNLVNGDTNGERDVFVYELDSGQITLISVSSDGTQGNDDSALPSISGNGRYVTFLSAASNFISNDENSGYDLFIHDREMGETRLVSVSSDGVQANGWIGMHSISADGCCIAFETDANNLVAGDDNDSTDIFLHSIITGQTRLISTALNGTPGNAPSWYPYLSEDGRYIAFESQARDLVEGDNNRNLDVFVYDGETGNISIVSVMSDGTQLNGFGGLHSMSGDGRYITLWTRDNYVGEDANGLSDIYIRDRETGQMMLISVASDGTSANGSSGLDINGAGQPLINRKITSDGNFVVLMSTASNLINEDINLKTDIFIHNRGED